MSPALRGSSAIWHFEGNDAIEIRDKITFDFYTGLSQMYVTFLAAGALQVLGTCCYHHC